MTNFALYLRQSVDVPEGIDRQRERCRQLAMQRGWDVVAEYADNATSASKRRGATTGWGRMLADAGAGRFTGVIAVDLDRLLRSNRDLIVLIDAGLSVATVDGEIDLSTADGEFRGQMLASIARFEVRRKGERQVRANEQRATKGIPTGGLRPFGWEEDRMTVRESEAHWVRWAHAHVLNGGSIRGVIRHFEANDVKPRLAETWSTAQVRKMLARPRNAGVLTRHGIAREESQIEAIVSPEEHAAVVALLASRSTKGRGRPAVASWLSGVLVCGGCGTPLTANWSTVRGERVRQYICRSTVEQRQAEGSKHYAIYAHLVEPHVVTALWKLSQDRTEPEAANAEVVALRNSMTELEVQRSRAQELYVLGGVDKVAITRTLTDLGKRIDALQAGIQTALSRDVTRALWADLARPHPSTWDTPEAAVGEAEFTARFEALDAEAKRTVTRGQFPQIIVSAGRLPHRVAFVPGGGWAPRG